MERSAIIRKTPNKEEWTVMSKKGKSLGKYKSKAKAEERLQQVEMFKHMKGKKRSSSEPLELFNQYLELASGQPNTVATNKQKMDEALRRAAASNPRLASVLNLATIPEMKWLQDEKLLKLSEYMVAAINNKNAWEIGQLIPKMFEILKHASFMLKGVPEKPKDPEPSMSPLELERQRAREKAELQKKQLYRGTPREVK